VLLQAHRTIPEIATIVNFLIMVEELHLNTIFP
jgi:hypothetical protein